MTEPGRLNSPTDGADALTAARKLNSAGKPVAALQKLASVRTQVQHQREFYDLATEALIAATTAPKSLQDWRGSSKTELYEALLLQEPCPAKPFVFHHSIASLMTSQQERAAGLVVEEIQPVLNRLLNANDAGKAVTLFALIVRSRARGSFSMRRLRSLHIRHFSTFDSLDLALPYSTAFNPGFRENRDELLAYYSGGVALQPEEGLTLVHLLLLEWLGLRIFVDVNNSDLAGALASRENSLDDAEQAAAARSLVLRHARPGNSELEQFAAGHGMSDVMLYLQSNRPGRPDLSKPTWLQGAILSKPLMAVRGVQAIVRPYMPSITRSRRRVRVAVSVSGQLRGFQKAAATWHKLFTPEVETDVYVHTWSAIGRSSAEPFRTMLPFDAPAFCEAWRRLGSRDGAEAMHERYPSLFRALNHSERISPDELAKFYGTTPDRVVIEDDQAEPFRGYSNPQKMHYKICAAFDLTQMESGRYDLHVRIRPDLGFRFAAFSWRDLMSVCQSRPILFCERGFGVHYGNPMIGDQFAIGSPDAMRSYAHAWTTYLQMAQLRPAQCPPEFHGHITLAQVLWFNNIDALRAPIGFGGLVEAEKLSAAEIRQAIVADADQRHDATDVAYLAALEQDLAALQPRQTVR